MNFTNFKTNIIDFVKEKYPDATDITVKEVLKNNGVVLNGITVLFKDENVSPTVYLEDLYDKYCAGKEFCDICRSLADTIETTRIKDVLDASFINDYSVMKHKIFCKLINREKNEKLLMDVPFAAELDLAVVFYCVIEAGQFGAGTVLIRNDMFKEYGVSFEEFYETAKKNTAMKLGASICPIEEVLFNIVDNNFDTSREEFEDEFDRITEGKPCPLYVLTNKSKCFGAATMLDVDTLDEFSKKVDSDIYILPSSVHELILVPTREASDIENLESIVREVNANEVDATDFLSDYVYMYNRACKAVELC